MTSSVSVSASGIKSLNLSFFSISKSSSSSSSSVSNPNQTHLSSRSTRSSTIITIPPCSQPTALSNNKKKKPSSIALRSTPICCSFSVDMDGTASPSVFPLHRCKTLHLVRHAQGIHNVEAEKDVNAFLSPALFDAALTTLGWQQVDNLRNHVHGSGLAKRIELVITSPLLRTMQTAVGVFGSKGYVDGMEAPPLMVANVGNSDRSAYSSLNCPPFVAVELCREHLGVRPCDKRRSITEYEPLFPAIDFSLIDTDEDSWWKADFREPYEDVTARGLKFFDWLWTRKEKEIAIVTHSGFLFHTLKAFGSGYHPLMKDEVCKHFTNCELRSMVIVDRSMIGSDSSVTNYQGKIPHGPDLPSDVAAEKHSEKTLPNSSS